MSGSAMTSESLAPRAGGDVRLKLGEALKGKDLSAKVKLPAKGSYK